ncbi:MAG: TRAP transporter small permease [Thermodesulfobacteriota bacterium]
MGQSPLGAFYGKLKKVNTVCATIAGIVLLFIAFSIFVDVFMRYVFNRPTIWITEISTYLFLYVIYLATAYALQEGTHIKVTFFLGCFEKKTERFIDLITQIMAIAFTVVLVWQTSAMTWSALKGNWTTPTMLNVPFAMIHGIMVLGSSLLLLSFICTTILYFTGEEKEPGAAA